MVLKSMNDPLIGDNGIDEEILLANPNIMIAKTKYGGHLGYYEAFMDTKQFSNKVIVAFLNSFLVKWFN